MTHTPGWGSQNFHPTKLKGDQTDYGDAVVLLLRFLAAEPNAKNGNPFPQAKFRRYWFNAMKHYDGYKTMAVKQTLQNLEAASDNLRESHATYVLAMDMKF